MMGYYNFGLGGLFMFFLWIVIIFGFFALIKVIMHSGNGHHHGHWQERKLMDDKSIAILKERYARGDISKEEYEEKKRILSS